MSGASRGEASSNKDAPKIFIAESAEYAEISTTEITEHTEILKVFLSALCILGG
jgi:hypothetical protein